MFTPSAAESVLKSFVGQNSGILSNCYIGLSTTTPAADGSNFTEPSAEAGYSRAIIGLQGQSGTQTMTVSGATATNDDIIFFPEATSSWGTITHFGLFNSATATTPMITGALTSSVVIGANYVPLFRAGNFTLTLS